MTCEAHRLDVEDQVEMPLGSQRNRETVEVIIKPTGKDLEPQEDRGKVQLSIGIFSCSKSHQRVNTMAACQKKTSLEKLYLED